MSIELERCIADNPPRIKQLQRLASIGVKSAIERDSFRTLGNNTNVHYLVDEFTQMVGEDDLDVLLPFEVRHRMAVRIGVRPPNREASKVWSLKFFDTYFTRPHTVDGQWHAERSTYRFEWTRNEVLMADRALRLVGFDIPGDGELDYNLDNFRVPEDIASIIEIEDELRMVSEDDCDELIEDSREYFSIIEGRAAR